MAPAPRKTTRQAAPAKGAASAVPVDKTLVVESDTPVTVDSGSTATGEGLAVSPGTDMSAMERAEAEADAEDARQEAAARSESVTAEVRRYPSDPAPQVAQTAVGTTVPADEPPKVTEGVYGPAGTKEEPTPAQLHSAPAPKKPKVSARAAQVIAAATGGGELADPEADADVIAPLIDPNHKTQERDLEALKVLADSSGLATPYPGEVKAPTPVRLPVLRNTYDWTREGDTGAVGRVLVDGFRVQCNGHYRFARKGDRVVAPDDVIDNAVSRGVMAKEG